jgi:hypothetical protein
MGRFGATAWIFRKSKDKLEKSHEALRYVVGETPIHRLKALEKALDSEKPNKNAISVMLVSSSLKYFWAKSSI